MDDEEWYEFSINCYSMDYKHPSGTRICLQCPKPAEYFGVSYNVCSQDICPELSDKKNI